MAGLYLQFVAYCKSTGESACSKTLFYEVGKEWHTCLRFHKKSNHAVCAVCSELRAQIRRCTEPRLILIMFFLVVFRPAPCALGHLCPSTLSHHMAAEDFVRHAHLCDELLGHFTQQYRDRELYYLARERSRGRKDLLTIIVDSYDKAKIVLPKFPMEVEIRRKGIMRNQDVLRFCLENILIRVTKLPCEMLFMAVICFFLTALKASLQEPTWRSHASLSMATGVGCTSAGNQCQQEQIGLGGRNWDDYLSLPWFPLPALVFSQQNTAQTTSFCLHSEAYSKPRWTGPLRKPTRNAWSDRRHSLQSTKSAWYLYFLTWMDPSIR